VTDEQPKKPATYGRGDLGELARSLAEKQPPKKPGAPAGEPDVIHALVFPTAWNAGGVPARYEMCGIGEHPVMGEWRVEGASVEQCHRRARWLFADALIQNRKLPSDEARPRAHRARIHATEMERRPGT